MNRHNTAKASLRQIKKVSRHDATHKRTLPLRQDLWLQSHPKNEFPTSQLSARPAQTNGSTRHETSPIHN